MLRVTLNASLFLTLVFALCAGILIADHTTIGANQSQASGDKTAPDLRRRVSSAPADELVSVVIQPRAGWVDELDSVLRNQGARGVRRFHKLSTAVVELPASAVASLAAHSAVAYVSLNREVSSLGHVSQTSGADAVRSANGATVAGLDGTGVGIAVLDSGMDATHKAFLDKSNTSRIIHSRDFTGEGRTDDPYGHGTHVASIAAGNGRISNGQYTGVAPNA